MYLGPFQNKILFQNELFLFCPSLKYFTFNTHFAKVSK
jgi:hypothetical protein